jgi:hypothetical protein
MSCYSCGPSKFSIEYQRRKKPENHNGCGCGSRAVNDCETESLAAEDSPLYNWEKKYGKLVTTVTLEQDSFGRKVQVVEKKPCKKEIKVKKTCCSVSYKAVY